MKEDSERNHSVKPTVRLILDGKCSSKIFADRPEAGLTYCAVCALSFLGKIPKDNMGSVELDVRRNISYEECVHSIVSRQSTYLEEIDEEEHQLDATQASSETSLESSPAIGYLPHLGSLSLDEEPRGPSPQPLNTKNENMRYVGFNGRTNKIVDTCYSFWNLGALAVSEAHFLPHEI